MAHLASELTHAQRVTRLYRQSLKHLLSWCIDRQTWRKEALQLRDRFDANKDVLDRRLATKLLEEGEEEFHLKKHPNPYISAFLLSPEPWCTTRLLSLSPSLP